MMDFRGQVVSRTTAVRGQMVINAVATSLQVDAAEFTDDDNFAVMLEANSCVPSKISKVSPSQDQR